MKFNRGASPPPKMSLLWVARAEKRRSLATKKATIKLRLSRVGFQKTYLYARSTITNWSTFQTETGMKVLCTPSQGKGAIQTFDKKFGSIRVISGLLPPIRLALRFAHPKPWVLRILRRDEKNCFSSSEFRCRRSDTSFGHWTLVPES